MFSDDSKWPFIVSLSNGIIGVSVLAMPFCLVHCGIVLGLIMLVVSAIITRFSCNLLIAGAHYCNKSSYEQYANFVLGPSAKTCVEICMILYTMATLVAFFIVIGDLGTCVFVSMVYVSRQDYIEGFRIVFTWCFALCVITPLCLLKNVRSLSFISSLAMLFYACLVLRLCKDSWNNLFLTEMWHKINYWRWSGILKCLSIFSMSLSCHTQLFVISSELPGYTPSRMDTIVSWAVSLCSVVYYSVGFYGYTANYGNYIPGDIIVLMGTSLSSQLLRLGFLMSVAVSYPIMVFPCRVAIYSMLKGMRRSTQRTTILDSNYDHQHDMPNTDTKVITIILVVTNVLIALSYPNMEMILSISGSVIGSLICFVIPAVLFLVVAQSSIQISLKRFASPWTITVAKICLVYGISTLICCTYASLSVYFEESELEMLVKLKSDLDTGEKSVYVAQPNNNNIENVASATNFTSRP